MKDSVEVKQFNNGSSHENRVEEEKDDLFLRMLKPYSTLIVRYPSVGVCMTVLAVIFSLLMSFYQPTGANPLPDFSDPLKGLQARGTSLASRSIALYNLQKYADPTASHRRKSILTINEYPLTGDPYKLENFLEGFLFIYEHENKEDIFPHMASLCQWYKTVIEKTSHYNDYVRFLHHIPNYIAWFNNKTDCTLITKNDTKTFKRVLRDCVAFYRSKAYLECKRNITACNVIKDECRSTKYIRDPQLMATLMFNTFHFLGDKSFKDDPSILKMTMSAAVLKKIDKADEKLFQPLYDKELSDIDKAKFENIKIKAFTMWGFKPYLFDQVLFEQCFYAVIAIAIVVVLTWLFSGSFFIGFTTFFCILIATFMSYFVYTRIYDVDFFPFININTLIFIVGIGADDVFVFTQLWREAKEKYKIQNTDEHIRYLIKWTSYTLRHAIVAMLVTSLTTAVSFYSNIASSVTAAKCFGLFAGTAILINYLLMFTYLPCAVVIHERYLSKWMNRCCPSVCREYPIISNTESSESAKYENENNNESTGCSFRCIDKTIFSTILPFIVCKCKYILILLFILLGSGGILVTFYKPGLHTPTESVYQIFSEKYSIEQYDLNYRQKFDYSGDSGQNPHEISFVFGVTAIDNGNKFDPESTGSLVLKKPLNVSQIQIYLEPFCERLSHAEFYASSKGCEQVDRLYEILTSPCPHGQNLCCGKKSFPINDMEFMMCVQAFMMHETSLNRTGIIPVRGRDGISLRALVLPVLTKYFYTMNFDYNRQVTKEIERWTVSEMKKAPDTLKGWWIGEFYFYDLQNSLYEGTVTSIGFAVAAAFVVILFTSQNIILSSFSILTMTLAIFTTIGTFVLLGWHLNIIESSIFTVAAGLSADFTLHYSVAYRNVLTSDRRNEKVKGALSHVGAPIVMGAVTTFIGGAVMMPATIKCYLQIGQFLMVVMLFSWLYSTFLFLPLCAALGPTGNTGEICCPKRDKVGKNQNGTHVYQDTIIDNSYAS